MKVEYIVMGRDQPNNAQLYSLENKLGKILSFSIVEEATLSWCLHVEEIP